MSVLPLSKLIRKPQYEARHDVDQNHWVQVYHMCYCSHVPEVHVVHHADPEP